MTLIHIDQIILDPAIQLQERNIDSGIVQSYVEAITNNSNFPPIVVFKDTSGEYYLADGFHRINAHRSIGLAEIDANIKEGTRQDAMIYAATANVTNGKPMSRREKQEAGERLLEMTTWQDPEIAQKLAVHRETVRLWRQTVSSKFLEDTRTVIRNGTTYEMDTSNIGRQQQGDEPEIVANLWDIQENKEPNQEFENDEDFGNGCHNCAHNETDASNYNHFWCHKLARTFLRDTLIMLCEGKLWEAQSEEEEPTPTKNQHIMEIMGSSKSPEWYTPQIIIDATLSLFEEIELDPCSNSHDTPNVPAKTIYTKEDNGLGEKWFGKVYMNPPYGTEIVDWTKKLIQEYKAGKIKEAIALLPGRIDTRWFQPFYDYLICHIKGRLQFSNSPYSAPFPSVVIYLGERKQDFIDSFKHLGPIMKRIA